MIVVIRNERLLAIPATYIIVLLFSSTASGALLFIVFDQRQTAADKVISTKLGRK